MGEAVSLAVTIQTRIESLVPLARHWRRFTPKQRQLADALDLELVRLMLKVHADDYFGALGLAPISDFTRISESANCIIQQFSEERVRAFGLHLKQGGWIYKARQINALVRSALESLTAQGGPMKKNKPVRRKRRKGKPGPPVRARKSGPPVRAKKRAPRAVPLTAPPPAPPTPPAVVPAAAPTAAANN